MRLHWSVAGWLWPLVVGGCEPSPRACLASEDIVPLSELGWFVPKEGEPVLLLTEGEMFVVALTGRADVRATATLETIADRQSLPQTNATPLPQGVRAEFRLTTSSTSMATIRVNDGTREGCWPARITEPVDRERIDAETERPPLAEILRLRAVARSLTRKGKGAESTRVRLEWGRLAAKHGYPSLAAGGFASAAYFLWRARLWNDARRALSSARATEALDPSPVGAMSRQIAESDIAADEGRFRLALSLAESADKTARALGDERAIIAAGERRARNLNQLQEPMKAIELLAELREAAGLAPSVRASVFNNEAYAHIRLLQSQGSRDPAAWAIPRELSEQAIRYGKAAERPRRVRVALTNLALIAEGLGEDDEVRRALARITAIDGFDTGYGQVEAEAVRSRLALREGRLRDARAGFEKALERTLTNTGGRASEDTWPLRLGLGRTLLAAGKKKKAAAILSAAMADLETLSLEAAVQETRARFLYDRREVFESAAQAFLDAGDPAAALSAVERARTLLLRSLQIGVRWARLAPAARVIAEDLAGNYYRAKQELASRGEDRRQVAKSDLEGFDATTRALSKRASGAAARLAEFLESETPMPAFDLDIDALRHRIPSDSHAVGFWTLGTKPYAFIISPKGLQVHSLAEGPGAAVSLLLELPGIGPLGVVLPPGRDRAEVLRSVAEDLLPRRPIVLLPSLTALTEPPQPAPGPPLIVGNPTEDLPSALREGRAIAKLYPASTLVSGAAATRTEVLAQMSGRQLLHFAGHGRSSPEDPWNASLTLAYGARLTVEEILLRAPVVETVVLSGCETGLFEQLAGGYGAGLPEAFLTAGSTYVVATTKPIEDTATSAVMTRFHRLAQKHGIVEGLRRTIIEAPPHEAAMARTLFVMQGRGPLATGGRW